MSDDKVRAMWSDKELDTALTNLRSDVDTDLTRIARSREELISAAGAAVPEPDDVPVVERLVEPVSRRRRSWWASSAAAVALVVAVVLVAQFVRGEEGLAPADPAVLLERAAANTSDEPVGPGQYRYVAEHGVGGYWVERDGRMESASVGGESVETWIPRDWRDDWMRRTVRCAEIATLPEDVPVGRAAPESCDKEPHESIKQCGAFGEFDVERTCNRPGVWTLPNQLFVDSLPRDPDALRKRLLADYATYLRGLAEAERDRAASGPAEQVMEYSRELLGSGLAPADLRAAVYRMIAKLPGLEVTDPDDSLEGRRGVAFGIETDGVRQELVIEPSTGEFIGTRTTYLRTKQLLPAGTEFYSSVSTAVVDEMGQEPR